MNTSQFLLRQSPERIVLSAGHGEGDPGVIDGIHREADETIILTDLIADNLRDKGLDVDVVPHSRGLRRAIGYVNENFNFGDAWAIEIHRNSADGVIPGSDRARKDLGVYYGNSQNSRLIGEFMLRVFLREGAHSQSWARSHTTSRFGRLGWIADTEPVAHLLELGFINGSHTNDYFQWLAEVAAIAIYEAFTGRLYETEPNVEPADLLHRLARSYAQASLADIFAELNITGVPVAHHQNLKKITMAQWILESGWATSRLATEHLNFAGLKWRSEMEEYAERVEYEAHDGRDVYCKFASIEDFITGYWKFLTRRVYDGWTEQTYSPQAFIRFLLLSGYTTGSDYDDRVLTLLSRAENLLNEAG